jgi:hypothetical protein
MNLLIPYVQLYKHPDPLFVEFTYGDAGSRGRTLKRLGKGDYVFFHTTIHRRKFVTAYYVVDRVMDTAAAARDRNIAAKYRNPHILEFLAGKKSADDVVIFGDPISSRYLERPLLFDRNLVERTTLNIKFPHERTETQAIASATRAWRELSDADIGVLLQVITASESQAKNIDRTLSTDEVSEVIEKDIEGFMESEPELIGKKLKLKRRQLDTPVGRIDLLFEDAKRDLVVVELKLNRIGRDALRQLRKYMDWLKRESGKEVRGAIVCSGVMPAFEEDFKKLKNIKVFCYGWQLKVFPWSGKE